MRLDARTFVKREPSANLTLLSAFKVAINGDGCVATIRQAIAVRPDFTAERSPDFARFEPKQAAR